ncbi:hypothetical protein U063_0240 [Helicobacter pylori BM012A]|uniref:Uncharacterized protein n=3 Tax=Helicobacter pylori TaxID=210 RepID=V5NNH9_HELPX|nr:hypothetical protein [Helicobacter pylori]AHA87605.1 hypothetical protein U063_0240 [Helicobacter pylori BM012A]AHA89177.1 hypothetical protein U064_0241 [Helicobacter pylori BM012S]
MRIWCDLGCFKGVCCRISSRPISSHYGADQHCKEHAMKRKSGKRSWKTLYFEFAFLGLKVIVSVKR